jgi:UDP-N-acetylglucosamine transferase subunit ALG13
VIFVTVGTQLNFDRMVSVVDTWAGYSGSEVVAQVGPTDESFSSVTHKSFLEPGEFDCHFESAEVVVAHAGMGSILTALSYGKPIIIMPRRAALGEHRNNHQMETAKRFLAQEGVWVAWDENELLVLLEEWQKCGFPKSKQISQFASDEFIGNLRDLIGGP